MELRAEQGELTGQIYRPERPIITVGRAQDSDIVLQEQGISRLHARLQRGAQGWTITDLGSTNGTFVNDYRITAPYEIKEGDELILSNCLFHLRTEEAQSPEQTVTVMKPK